MGEVSHAYLLEAKGIQRYLFLSGRLRDVVGASDLVLQIARADGNDWIKDVISDAGFTDASLEFSRRAGGSFCLHGPREKLVQVRRAMRLRIMRELPGLEFADALGEGADPLAAGSAAMECSGGLRANSAASVLPLGRPVLAIVPRTGLPQVEEDRSSGEPLDAIVWPQRQRANELQKLMGSVRAGDPWIHMLDGVAKRFHGTPADNRMFVYPRNLAQEDEDVAENPLFPWINGSTDRRIALVHADLSGLGQIFANAPARTPKGRRELAGRIEKAILGAVHAANHAVLLPRSEPHARFREIVPARPIVLGGDDVTVLVRADLALPFTARLLDEIEARSKDIAGGLSACAGVAISSASLPFLTLNELAESLCKFAKKRAKERQIEGKPFASLLAFHVQTHTAEEDYGRHIYPGLKAQGYGALTANPFAVGGYAGATGCLEWNRLFALAESINSLGGAFGTLRTIRGEVASGRLTKAKDLWHRMFSRVDRSPDQAARLTAFREALSNCTAQEITPYALPSGGAMFDALELVDLGLFPSQPAQERTLEELTA